MRKTLFFIFSVAFCISLGAQSYMLKDFKNVTKDAYRTVSSTDQTGFTPAERPSYFVQKNHGEEGTTPFHVIGGSHYISATNAYARNTVSWSPDGSTCAAAWTMGSSGGNLTRRRGTGINYYDQSTETWGDKPSLTPASFGAVETGLTAGANNITAAWGTHVFTEQGECVVAHVAVNGNPANPPSGLFVNTRDIYNEGTWEQYVLKGPALMHPDIQDSITSYGLSWPTLVAVDNTIHMVCVTDQDTLALYSLVTPDSTFKMTTCPLYYRSTDGGKTWEDPITFLGSMPIEDMLDIGGDQYMITANGDHIVFVYGRGGVAYLESRDGGDTWTHHIVYDAGPWSWESTGVPVGPALYATTATAAIGDDGVVHVAFSTQMRMRRPDTEPWNYSYFSALCAMYVWREGQPIISKEDNMNLVYDFLNEEWVSLEYEYHIDAPDLLGYGDGRFRFWSTISMITSAFNNSGYIIHPRLLAKDGKVYLMYSSIVQEPMVSRLGDDEAFFRGVFLTVSHDNGETYDQINNTSWLSYHPDFFLYDWYNYIQAGGPDLTAELGEERYPDGIEVLWRSENAYPTMAMSIENNQLMFSWIHYLYPFPDATPSPVWQSAEFQIFAFNIPTDTAGKYHNIKDIWHMNPYVSVKEVSGKIENLKIYPNPANDRTIVEVNTNAPYTLTVTNVMGQVMHTMKGAQNRVELNVSNFAPGVYIVNVRTANATTSQKLIVK